MLSGKQLRSVGIGMILVLVGIGLGGTAEFAFRFNRKSFIEDQRRRAEENIEVFQVEGQPITSANRRIEEALDVSWELIGEFHREMAWRSMGAVALLLLLCQLKGPNGLKQVVGTAIGLGAAFHPMSWLFAAHQVAEKGVDEAMRWVRPMATVTQACFMLGVIGVLLFVIANLFRRDKKKVRFAAEE